MRVTLIDGKERDDRWVENENEFMELLWPVKKCTIEATENGWDAVTVTILEKLATAKPDDLLPEAVAFPTVYTSDIVTTKDDFST